MPFPQCNLPFGVGSPLFGVGSLLSGIGSLLFGVGSLLSGIGFPLFGIGPVVRRRNLSLGVGSPPCLARNRRRAPSKRLFRAGHGMLPTLNPRLASFPCQAWRSDDAQTSADVASLPCVARSRRWKPSQRRFRAKHWPQTMLRECGAGQLLCCCAVHACMRCWGISRVSRFRCSQIMRDMPGWRNRRCNAGCRPMEEVSV